MSVAAHVASLERRISQRIDPSDPPLSWESDLRDNPVSRRRSFNVYRANFTIIFLLAAIGSVIGNIGLARHTSPYVVGVATVFDDLCYLRLCVPFYAPSFGCGDWRAKHGRRTTSRFWQSSSGMNGTYWRCLNSMRRGVSELVAWFGFGGAH